MSLFCEERRTGRGMAFVQYMEYAPPLDALVQALECLCLRWAKTDGGDDESEVGRFVKVNDGTVAGEWFGAISFQVILSTARVVRGNIAVHPFGTELAWNRHWFYITNFFQRSWDEEKESAS